jgi:hypothetical protein
MGRNAVATNATEQMFPSLSFPERQLLEQKCRNLTFKMPAAAMTVPANIAGNLIGSRCSRNPPLVQYPDDDSFVGESRHLPTTVLMKERPVIIKQLCSYIGIIVQECLTRTDP